MRITLEEKQIKDAITDYLKKQGLSLQGKHVETTFTVGRGANPTTVEIAIRDSSIAESQGPTPRMMEEKTPPVEDSQAEVENDLTEAPVSEVTGKSLFTS